MKTQIQIIPGAGGIESESFCEMLKTMYRNWAHNNGYTVTETNTVMFIEGNITGIEQEHGIHCLKRINPRDALNRRHTSFCKVLINNLPDMKWDNIIRNYVFHPYNSVINTTNQKQITNANYILAGYPNLLWNN